MKISINIFLFDFWYEIHMNDPKWKWSFSIYVYFIPKWCWMDIGHCMAFVITFISIRMTKVSFITFHQTQNGTDDKTIFEWIYLFTDTFRVQSTFQCVMSFIFEWMKWSTIVLLSQWHEYGTDQQIVSILLNRMILSVECWVLSAWMRKKSLPKNKNQN